MNRKQLTVLATFLLLTVIVMMATPVFALDSDIVISEVMYTPNGGTNAEWVEIYNKGAIPVDLQNWQICDNTTCDTITAGSFVIAPQQYVVIAVDSASLTAEFASYTSTPAVNGAQTIYLGIGNTIGNSLGNATDMVYLVSDVNTCGVGADPCVSDCIAYGGLGGCSARTDYFPGSDGFDTVLDPPNTQPLINIQGVWQAGQLNDPSPYVDNVASGGAPTAITLNQIEANSQSLVISMSIAGLVFMLTTIWLVFRRKTNA